MKRFWSIIAVAVLLAACSAPRTPRTLDYVTPSQAGLDSALLSRVDTAILNAIECKTIPGAVLSVVRGDKIAYLKAYGNSQVVPDTVQMTAGTVFDLASVSKCVGTTLSVMQLLERQLIGLEDNVSDYIPGFLPFRDTLIDEDVNITIRELLSHSSGLDPYANVESLSKRYGEPCPDSLMQYIAREAHRNFKPGTDFMYSCLNFVTLQNILQKVTGERLCDYAQREVFDALGLEHTCYLPDVNRPDLMESIAPTTVQPDGKPFKGVVHDPLARRLNGGNSGNAGVFSNAEDLSVIAAAIMCGGEVNGRRILKSETVQLMCTVPYKNDPRIGRALGWDMYSSHSSCKGTLTSPRRTLCHTGYTGPSMVIDLDNRLAIILLAHRCHPYDVGSMKELRAEVADIVAGALIR